MQSNYLFRVSCDRLFFIASFLLVLGGSFSAWAELPPKYAKERHERKLKEALKERGQASLIAVIKVLESTEREEREYAPDGRRPLGEMHFLKCRFVFEEIESNKTDRSLKKGDIQQLELDYYEAFETGPRRYFPIFPDAGKYYRAYLEVDDSGELKLSSDIASFEELNESFEATYQTNLEQELHKAEKESFFVKMILLALGLLALFCIIYLLKSKNKPDALSAQKYKGKDV